MSGNGEESGDSTDDDGPVPVMLGLLLGLLVVVVVRAVAPAVVALVAGAVVGYAATRKARDADWSTGWTAEGSTLAGTARTAMRDAAVVINDAETDVPGRDRLPVSRGILDRAERYLDHDANGRARRTAERASRVADREAAVRSTLAEVQFVRHRVDAVRRIEGLLGDAEGVARTDPDRAEELVDEARDLADRLGPRLRSVAADRAEEARRADGERARRLWSEAYELADAAADIALDGGSGSSPDPVTGEVRDTPVDRAETRGTGDDDRPADDSDDASDSDEVGGSDDAGDAAGIGDHSDGEPAGAETETETEF